MLTPITKRSKKVRRRNLTATQPQPTTPIVVTAASAAGNVLSMTFGRPVTLHGVPAYTTDVVGATATSAEQTSPTSIAITFSASIAAANAVNIPYEEPAVRNASGGFVSTSTFPV